MSASSRGPVQTMLPSSMNARVSATLSAFCACSSTRRTGAAAVAELEDGVHHRVGGEGREAEGRLVGDEHDGRVGEGRREAQHLLLAAGEEAGDLLAPLREDREALVGVAAELLVAEEHGQVLLHGEAGEDAPGLGHEEHAGASSPERLGVGDLLALEEHLADGGVDHAGGDRAEGGLAGAVGAEQRGHLAPVDAQVDAVEDLGVAVAGDHPSHGERGLVHVARARGSDRGSRRARRAFRRLLGVVMPLVLGDHAAVHLGLGRGDAGQACLLPLLAQLLLAGEGEDAVGLLRELDGTETRQDRHEEDRR